MTLKRTLTPDGRLGRHGRRLLFCALGLVAAAIALTWGWNTVAVELFAQPAAAFKHGLAAAVALAAAAALVGRAAGAGRGDGG